MRRRAPGVVATALGLAVLVPSLPGPASAAGADDEAVAVAYAPPVDAPVVDTFRPPRTPYGRGNRGVDYATRPGAPVRAAAPGVVAFAGPVGGSLHVVVLHGDGLRTSYSFLTGVAVRRGQRVGAAQVVGTAGVSLHFGARAGEAYLDPLVLLEAAGAPQVYLVPDDERRLRSEEHERGVLARLLGALPRAGLQVAGTAVDWARQAHSTVASVTPRLDPLGVWLRALAPAVGAPMLQLALVPLAWWEQRGTCTPAGVAPPRPYGRRLAILVAGFGSTSRRAAVDGVDTAALGYAPADVARFSYRGGTIAERPYDREDSEGDIVVAGGLLRALLERVHAANPGVPIDVIAHSQGGLVARAALGQRAPPGVAHVITLGSPHQGADLATALDLLSSTVQGAMLKTATGWLRPGGMDPRSTALAQMSERSSLIRRLDAQVLPPGVRFTSVAAREDPVVAAPRTRLAGARHVVISVMPPRPHSARPGSRRATREMALASAGMAPTCEGLGEALADSFVGLAISAAEDLGGRALVGALP